MLWILRHQVVLITTSVIKICHRRLYCWVISRSSDLGLWWCVLKRNQNACMISLYLCLLLSCLLWCSIRVRDAGHEFCNKWQELTLILVNAFHENQKNQLGYSCNFSHVQVKLSSYLRSLLFCNCVVNNVIHETCMVNEHWFISP